MSPLERLGFEPDEPVVGIHVDDVGMSDAANAGSLAARTDAATCASPITRCPALETPARIPRERTELDPGAHLTLNTGYESWRWGPLRDDVPGLVAPDGGMCRTTREVVEHGSADEVERELRAQSERALAAGIDVTHLDSHMGTVIHAKFVKSCVRLGLDDRLPIFLPRPGPELLARGDLAHRLAGLVARIDRTEGAGLPVFGHFCTDLLLSEPGADAAHNRASRPVRCRARLSDHALRPKLGATRADHAGELAAARRRGADLFPRHDAPRTRGGWRLHARHARAARPRARARLTPHSACP